MGNLPVVDKDRVQNWLSGQDLKFDVDDDGDLRVGFEEVVLFIHFKDEFIRVQGYWYSRFPEEQAGEVLNAVNALNSSMIIPKSMANPEAGLVIFETSAITVGGWTDEQLDNWLSASFTAIFKAASDLGESLPNLAPNGENN